MSDILALDSRVLYLHGELNKGYKYRRKKLRGIKVIKVEFGVYVQVVSVEFQELQMWYIIICD